MPLSPKATAVRYATRQLFYRSSHNQSERKTISPLVFLSIPIYERLIILARLDGATAYQTQQAFRCRLDDADLATDRMELALARLRAAVLDPFAQLADVPIDVPVRKVTEDYRRLLERTGWQLLYPEVALCLFGDLVPRELVSLSLRDRGALYCLLVEDMERVDVQALLRCTDFFLETRLTRMMELTGQTAKNMAIQTPNHAQT